MAIGFRINARQRQVDRETVEKFRSIAVANVSDSMNRMEHGGPHLRPLHRTSACDDGWDRAAPTLASAPRAVRGPR